MTKLKQNTTVIPQVRHPEHSEGSPDVSSMRDSGDPSSQAPRDDVPGEIPRDDVPGELPRDDVPGGLPQDDVPPEWPRDDVPGELPWDDVPREFPSKLHVIILAAGQGTRMKADIPKVLHPLAGRPLLEWVIAAAAALNPAKIHVIEGHGGAQIRAAFAAEAQIQWIHQPTQLGTGHAVLQALPYLPDEAQVLILAGDVPLIQPSTLARLVSRSGAETLGLLVAKIPDATGYGRILRDVQQQVVGIIEEKDATPAQRLIQEYYTGICVASGHALKAWLPQIKPHNSQKEYYLTDLVSIARAQGGQVQAVVTPHVWEVQGVNSRLDLVRLERTWQQQEAERLLQQGVGIADPARFDVRGHLTVGKGVFFDINVICEGEVIVEDGCSIGPNCVLKDVHLGAHTQILANSVLDGVVTGSHCAIGPFARLRPQVTLASHCKIGNFVEAKQTSFGEHSKANHLTYLGDTTLGEHVNIGAGTITCNYDGTHKHPTTIGDHVFIGSGTQLIAPIHIGDAATIGAGTTLRRDAPAEALTLTVREQKTVPGWKKKS